MRKNKGVVICIAIVCILAIIVVGFTYLFFMTDILKSNEELFMKYFAQNIELFEEITDFEAIEVYENLKNENKYESNTNIKMIHSEGGEISNPLNNLSFKLDIQKDKEKKYVYADGKILYENEPSLEAEVIKEKEIYGIRFSDAVQQFVTIKKGENTEQVANDLNIDLKGLELLLDIIDGEQQIITTNEINLLKNELMDIIAKNIVVATFEKEKSTAITFNENLTKVNSYSVSLTSDQVEGIITELLNCIRNKIQILNMFEININDLIEKISEKLKGIEVKIIIYEQNQKLLRTDIQMEFGTIIIENINRNIDEIIAKITFFTKNNTPQYIIEVNKNNINNQETCNISINTKKGNKNNKILFSTKMKLIDNNIEFNTEITSKQNITTISMILENKINMLDEIEKKETLNKQNNFLISAFEVTKRKQFINLLKSIVEPKMNERRSLLMQKLIINNEYKDVNL